jgi:LysM repeat protein
VTVIYRLFAATNDNRLWVRDPVLSDVNWQHIGHANNVRAMAFGNSMLFAATSDNRLWVRDPVLSDVNWQHIGHANNVVGMTFVNGHLFPAAPSGRLFAATSDNRLWVRDPVLSDVNWQHIGHANNVVGMTHAEARERTYTVKPGDTLAGIARQELGDANRWPEIFVLNRDIVNHRDRILPGQVFTLPGPTPMQPRPRLYTVRSGDTLSRIAQRELGDANRWREIARLNRDVIPNPDLIRPGQVLVILPT